MWSVPGHDQTTHLLLDCVLTQHVCFMFHSYFKGNPAEGNWKFSETQHYVLSATCRNSAEARFTLVHVYRCFKKVVLVAYTTMLKDIMDLNKRFSVRTWIYVNTKVKKQSKFDTYSVKGIILFKLIHLIRFQISLSAFLHMLYSLCPCILQHDLFSNIFNILLLLIDLVKHFLKLLQEAFQSDINVSVFCSTSTSIIWNCVSPHL